MNIKVIIIGAGGHGHVISDVIQANGDIVSGYLDDLCEDALGPISDYKKYADAQFVIGIGDTHIREKVSAIPVKWYTAIHPSAIISPSVAVGEGSVVMANAVINANSRIGKHCIVNTAAVVEHDNQIEDYAHVSVGARLGGTVKVGKRTWVGIGSTISNNVSICDNCMIGAGAVVIKSIDKSGTYIGVPARLEEK